jgi:hypothetical protein
MDVDSAKLFHFLEAIKLNLHDFDYNKHLHNIPKPFTAKDFTSIFYL